MLIKFLQSFLVTFLAFLPRKMLILKVRFETSVHSKRSQRYDNIQLVLKCTKCTKKPQKSNFVYDF